MPDVRAKGMAVSSPSFYVTAQGSTEVLLNENRPQYDPAHGSTKHLLTVVELGNRRCVRQQREPQRNHRGQRGVGSQAQDRGDQHANR